MLNIVPPRSRGEAAAAAAAVVLQAGGFFDGRGVRVGRGLAGNAEAGRFIPAAPELRPLLAPSPCPLLTRPAGPGRAGQSLTRGPGRSALLVESLLEAATGSRCLGRGFPCRRRRRPDRRSGSGPSC